MSGIQAAAQSSGCCCRPQEGCTCSDPNRPGAIIDRGLTSIAVESEMSLEDAERDNGCSSFGCSCPCSGNAIYGSPGGVQYGYQRKGAIVDPEFTEGTECESLACRAGCCGGCPVWECRSNFGSCIAEQDAPGQARWLSVTRTVLENVAGIWNWAPTQEGYCTTATDPLLRIRKYCPFSYVPLGDGPIDPNGQYVNVNTGQYTGTNIGLLFAYKAVEVYGCCGPAIPAEQCGYRVRIAIGYLFQHELQEISSQTPGGGMRGIALRLAFNGIVAEYFKPCVSPTDTVMGEYAIEYQPEYDYADEDSECGRIRFFRERLASFPQTLTVG